VEQDVTVRRQTQERLQEAMNHTEQLVGALSWEKTLLAGVISAVPQLVFWKDSHGRYVGCNEAYLAFRGIGGQSEVLGRSDSDIGLDDPLNMIVNAAQAIAEQRDRGERAGLGSITISTARTQAEFVITITDDGPGMTEKVRDRVFDPFFTTKDVGKGTGQGLSLAHAVIVTKHQGRILLETAPGQGATFTLRLPLHVADTPLTSS
jgi:PAS domain-containing protein